MESCIVVIEPRKIQLLNLTRLAIDGIQQDLNRAVLFHSFSGQLVLHFFAQNSHSFLATIDSSLYCKISVNEHETGIYNDTTKSGSIVFKLNFIFPTEKNFDILQKKVPKTQLIGHRGSGSNALGNRVRENTLLSFRRAAEKLDGVELDVLLTRDRQLVIYHDLEYPVQFGNETRSIPIADLNYSDLNKQPKKFARQMSLDSNKFLPVSSFIMEDVPLLQTVLTSLPAKVGIVIELKYPTNNTIRANPSFGRFTRHELVHAVVQAVKNSPNREWIVLSSFDPDICLMLTQAVPFLIVHNTWFGHQNDGEEDNTVDFTDIRNACVEAAHAQAQHIKGGLAFEAKYALDNPSIDKYKVPLLSYGKDNLNAHNVSAQIARNFWGIFVDGLKINYST